LLDLGYSLIIKSAIKHPNLETKDTLFQLLLSNLEYLHKRQLKQVVMAIIRNYLDVFSKFLIYVPNYVNVVKFILEIDQESKKIINTANPERQPQLELIFIDLSSQQLSQIRNVVLEILRNTGNKVNYYALHRNCLKTLKSIGETINQFKIK
jgi:hypothetical protein